MIYNKHNFRAGQPLSALQLNEMQNGISQITDVINNIQDYIPSTGGNAGVSSKNKRTFGKCYFSYQGYDMNGIQDIEYSAKILATYDLVCCQGALTNKNSTDNITKEREFQIIKRAKQLNPRVKFFKYITANSSRDLDSNGNKKPVRKSQLMTEIAKAISVPGISNPNETISFDGIMWDEAESTASVGTSTISDWRTLIEKINWYVAECHKYNLSCILNAWDFISLINGAQQCIAGQDENIIDYFLLESAFFAPSDLENGDAYWSEDSIASRTYEYMKNYYNTQKVQVITFSSTRANVDEQTRQKQLTWMLWNTFVQGGHYVCFDNANPVWDIPQDLINLIPNKQDQFNVQKTANGYKLVTNGHTIEIVYDIYKGRAKVTKYSFDDSYIRIDNQHQFINDVGYASSREYDIQKSIDKLNDTIDKRKVNSKDGANTYVRAIIDDTSKEINQSSYTNLLPALTQLETEKTYFSEKNGLYGGTIQFEDSSRTGLKYKFNSAPYFGHTLQVGLNSIEQSDAGTIWLTIYKNGNWFQDVYHSNRNESLIGNESGICYSFEIANNDNAMFEIALYKTVESTVTTTIQNLYLVDVNEFSNDVTSKDFFTNISGKNNQIYTPMPWQQYIPNRETNNFECSPLQSNRSLFVNFTKDNAGWQGPLTLISGKIVPGHTYEIGCESYTSNTNTTLMRGMIPGYGYTPSISQRVAAISRVFNKRLPCATFSIPTGCNIINDPYIEIVNTSDQHTTETGSNKNVQVIDWYLYDLDEQNVALRGVTPVNTFLRFARIENYDSFEIPGTLLSDTVYFTLDGHIYLTDYNKNITQYV